MSKTRTLIVHHAFWYISLLSMRRKTEIPIFKFFGGLKQATTKFSFPLWTWIWLLGTRLAPGEFACICKASELKWSVYIHCYATFSWPSASWLLNSLMFQPGWVRYCVQRCDIYAPIPSIYNHSIQIYINLFIDCYWKSIPIDNQTNLCHQLVIDYQYQSINWYCLVLIDIDFHRLGFVVRS